MLHSSTLHEFVRITRLDYDTHHTEHSCTAEFVHTNTVHLISHFLEIHEILVDLKAQYKTFFLDKNNEVHLDIKRTLKDIDHILLKKKPRRSYPKDWIDYEPNMADLASHITSLHGDLKQFAKWITHCLTTGSEASFDSPLVTKNSVTLFGRQRLMDLVDECYTFLNVPLSNQTPPEAAPATFPMPPEGIVAPYAYMYRIALRSSLCKLLFLVATRKHFDIIKSVFRNQLSENELETRIRALLIRMEETRAVYVRHLTDEDSVVAMDVGALFGIEDPIARYFEAVQSPKYVRFVSIASKIVTLLETRTSYRLGTACQRSHDLAAATIKSAAVQLANLFDLIGLRTTTAAKYAPCRFIDKDLYVLLKTFAVHHPAFFTHPDAPNLVDFLSNRKKNAFYSTLKKKCTERMVVTDLKLVLNHPSFYESLVDFFESASGAIRVVLKVADHTIRGRAFPPEYGIEVVDGTSLKIIDCLTTRPKTYGPFHKIAPFKADARAFKETIGVLELTSLLQNGQNVMIFTYGFSGSGKSFCLMGDAGSTKRSGLIYDFLTELRLSVSLTSIKMLYGYVESSEGKISMKERVVDMETEAIKAKVGDFNKGCRDRSIANDVVFQKLNDVLSTLNERHPIADVDDFIKSTPNNKDSSRGFLFLDFQVGKQTLRFVDMAGNEDPYDLMIKILPTYNLPTTSAPKANYLQSNSHHKKDAIYALFRRNLKLAIENIVEVLQPVLKPFMFIKSAVNMENNQKNIVGYINRLCDKTDARYIENYFDTSHSRFDVLRSQDALLDRLNFSFKVIGLRVLYQTITDFSYKKKELKPFYDGGWLRQYQTLLKDGERRLAEHVLTKRGNVDGLLASSILVSEIKAIKEGQHYDFDISMMVDHTVDVAMLYYSILEMGRHVRSTDVDVDIYKMLYTESKTEGDYQTRLRGLTLDRYIQHFVPVSSLSLKPPKVLVCVISQNLKNAINPVTMRSWLENLDKFFTNRVQDNTVVRNEYLERILREGYYINQVNFELIEFFKSKMDNVRYPARTLSDFISSDPEIDPDCLMLEHYTPSGKVGGMRLARDSVANNYDRNITRITDASFTGNSDNTKYFMICTLRPEPDVKFRVGAMHTLDLVSELKST